jgi:hypothetical protein
MGWIPHLMILDDDPRVLESLVPSVVDDLARGFAKSKEVGQALRRGDPAGASAIHIKVSAHGYESKRLADYRYRTPHHAHLHLVRERGGRFDLARRLLNEQLFAVVVSDLRFSDDAGGQRAGQLLIDEAARVHPELEGLLYSAYPRPEEFPAERFVRKVDDGATTAGLPQAMVAAVERYLAQPSVSAFATALADLGIVYQSESFGTTLAQLFDLARLFGPEPPNGASRLPGRGRRPLQCLLLDGESGTGKRGLAELFHLASERRKAPMVVASCNELTNETLLRSTLFGHRRGAFTDARDDRPGLVVSAGKGMVLLDDFHRLPTAGTAILHSFLEDGEYSRLGEEEVRRHAEAAVVLTVETEPWAERRRSGELPLSFLARVERLPLSVPPLRERPEDIEAQARWIVRSASMEVGASIELADDTIEGFKSYPFADSNSRELRNVIERAVVRHKSEVDVLTWAHLQPFLVPVDVPSRRAAAPAPPLALPYAPPLNDWQRRVRALAAKLLAKGAKLEEAEAQELAASLLDSALPPLWAGGEHARARPDGAPPLPWPLWEDLWRCFAIAHLGGPTPAERVLGIPANTLRQWISDHESR